MRTFLKYRGLCLSCHIMWSFVCVWIGEHIQHPPYLPPIPARPPHTTRTNTPTHSCSQGLALITSSSLASSNVYHASRAAFPAAPASTRPAPADCARAPAAAEDDEDVSIGMAAVAPADEAAEGEAAAPPPPLTMVAAAWGGWAWAVCVGLGL